VFFWIWIQETAWLLGFMWEVTDPFFTKKIRVGNKSVKNFRLKTLEKLNIPLGHKHLCLIFCNSKFRLCGQVDQGKLLRTGNKYYYEPGLMFGVLAGKIMVLWNWGQWKFLVGFSRWHYKDFWDQTTIISTKKIQMLSLCWPSKSWWRGELDC